MREKDPPPSERIDDLFSEVDPDKNGIFGCVDPVGCHDACPKGLPLLERYPYLRRKMLGAAKSP